MDSPRLPRRFSRWQTSKRTFNLGGIVSKPQAVTDKVLPEELPRSSKADHETSSVRGPGTKEASVSRSSQSSGRPKPARSLRHDQSREASKLSISKGHISNEAGLVNNVEGSPRKNENGETSQLSPKSPVMKKNTGLGTINIDTDHLKQSFDKNHRTLTNRSAAKEPNSLESKSNSLASGLSNSQALSPPALSLLSHSAETIPDKSPLRRSSPRKHFFQAEPIGDKGERNKGTTGLTSSLRSGADALNGTGSHRSGCDTSDVFSRKKLRDGTLDSDKENQGEGAVSSPTRNSGTTRITGPKTRTTKSSYQNGSSLENIEAETDLSVDQALSHSEGKTSAGPQNTHSSKSKTKWKPVASNDVIALNFSVNRGSLRDRSRLSTPAEMLKQRQYPQEFLSGKKRQANQSLNMSNASQKDRKSPKQYTPSPEKSIDRVSTTDQNMSKLSASSKVTGITKEIVSKANLVTNSTKEKHNAGSKIGKDHSVVSNNQSIIAQPEKEANSSSKRPQHAKSTLLPKKTATVSHHDSNPSLKADEPAVAEDDMASNRSKLGKQPASFAVPQADSNKKGRSKVTNTDKTKKKASDSSKGSLSLDASSNSLNQTQNSSSSGRSLRDRSKLPTPESVQSKRQYPISFFFSKKEVESFHDSQPSSTTTEAASTKGGKKLSHKSKLIKSSQSSEKQRALSSVQKSQGKGYITESQENDIDAVATTMPPPVHQPRPAQSSGKSRKFSGNNSKCSVPADVASCSTSKPSLQQKPPPSRTKKVSEPVQKSSQPQRLQNQQSQALAKKMPQALSLPKKGKEQAKQGRSNSQTSHRNSVFQNSEDEVSVWQITAPSTSSKSLTKPAKTSHRLDRNNIDDTVISTMSRRPSKRKLIDQLSQAEISHKSRKTTTTTAPKEILLWCEKDQTRLASDVTAHDVVFTAALELEERLREEADDNVTDRLMQRVFSGFKRGIKSEISQLIELKALKKDVAQRKKRCKNLTADIAEKYDEAARLEKEINSLENSESREMQKINNWMHNFSRLMSLAQD